MEDTTVPIRAGPIGPSELESLLFASAGIRLQVRK